MSNQFSEMSASKTWNVLVRAAVCALKEQGLSPSRLPGRGRSNIWEIEEEGRSKKVSIRTTKDRWFAFPPLKNGTEWKTLDKVEIVVVAAVDDREDPRSVEVYRFDANEVRERFKASYEARIAAGHIVIEDFGMWVNLDVDNREIPASVGAGLASEHAPIAVYPLEDVFEESGAETIEAAAGDEEEGDDESGSFSPSPDTIADVMEWARKRIATLSGMRLEAVRLDCRLEK